MRLRFIERFIGMIDPSRTVAPSARPPNNNTDWPSIPSDDGDDDPELDPSEDPLSCAFPRNPFRFGSDVFSVTS